MIKAKTDVRVSKKNVLKIYINDKLILLLVVIKNINLLLLFNTKLINQNRDH